MAVTHLVLFRFRADLSPEAVSDVRSNTTSPFGQPRLSHSTLTSLQACAKLMALKDTCIHPATQEPYILSLTGGKDHSPKKAQVRVSNSRGRLCSIFDKSDRMGSRTPLESSLSRRRTGITTSRRTLPTSPSWLLLVPLLRGPLWLTTRPGSSRGGKSGLLEQYNRQDGGWHIPPWFSWRHGAGSLSYSGVCASPLGNTYIYSGPSNLPASEHCTDVAPLPNPSTSHEPCCVFI